MSAFLKFITEDWYFAYPMFAMSLTGLALLVWRILLNINGNTDLNAFLPELQAALEKDGTPGALQLCQDRTDYIPRRLFTAGLENAKQGTAAMRRAMANAVELEILPDLNFLLPTILAIAKIATMVGLLGTVLSMIGTFSQIQASKGGVTEHAGAIGLALFATALGLVTAIPLAFSHVLFKAWVAQFEVRMKAAAQKLLLLVQNVKQPAAAKAASSTAVAATPARPAPRPTGG
jgi:biopolymer transport protein ExbB